MRSRRPDRRKGMAIDLTPAVRALSGVLDGIPDDALGGSTPCEASTVGDLVHHVGGFALAFTGAAQKQPLGPPTPPSAAELPDDWRTAYPVHLAELAEAWADEAAWDGMTAAGGIDLPGEVAGLIALDEVVVHGWDLAVATGQPYELPDAVLVPLHGFVEQFVGSTPPREGLFKAAVPVPEDAPLLHRVLGLTGRDPGWRPRR